MITPVPMSTRAMEAHTNVLPIAPHLLMAPAVLALGIANGAERAALTKMKIAQSAIRSLMKQLAAVLSRRLPMVLQLCTASIAQT